MDKKASKTLPRNDRTRPFFQMHQPGKLQKNFPAKTNQFLIRTFYFLNYVSFASFVHEKSFNSRCYVQKWICVKIEPKPMYRSFNNWEMNLSPFLFHEIFLQSKTCTSRCCGSFHVAFAVSEKSKRVSSLEKVRLVHRLCQKILQIVACKFTSGELQKFIDSREKRELIEKLDWNPSMVNGWNS